MANEIALTAVSGQTLYVILRNSAGQPYNSSATAFEAYNSANYTSYALALTEQGTTGYYLGSVPSAVAAPGRYTVQAKVQSTGTPGPTDTSTAAGPLRWNGTAEVDVLASNDKTGYALSSAEHTLVSGTDVPAALTAQGYTTARAGYLDTLNGLVAAIWNTLTSALTTSGSIGALLAKFGFDGSSNVKATTQAYASGQDPASLVLSTAANKLVTNVSGQVQHDMTQGVPTTNTAQTVGDALNAARAGSFGKWVIAGTTLTLYAPDGTTAVRSFVLDNATSPSSRT